MHLALVLQTRTSAVGVDCNPGVATDLSPCTHQDKCVDPGLPTRPRSRCLSRIDTDLTNGGRTQGQIEMNEGVGKWAVSAG